MRRSFWRWGARALNDQEEFAIFFKSYDGWKAVDYEGRKIFLAEFTRADNEIVRYNISGLRRMHEKPSANFENSDKSLVRKALDAGPSFFKYYNGWRNTGRGGKTIMVAHFIKASGQSALYGLKNLMNMKASKPAKFSEFDAVVLETAIAQSPAPKR